MRAALFTGLLLAVVFLSWWRGRSDERVAALVCVAGTLLTHFAGPVFRHRFALFDASLFLIDLGVLVAFVALALRSSRFWPLWVAGLQLTTTVVHLLKLIDPDLMPFVVGAALAFWSYPILLLIGIGAWRTRTVEHWRAQHRLQRHA